MARFLDFLLVERGLSRNTLEAYRRDLTLYGAYLTARGVSDATDRSFEVTIIARTCTPVKLLGDTCWTASEWRITVSLKRSGNEVQASYDMDHPINRWVSPLPSSSPFRLRFTIRNGKSTAMQCPLKEHRSRSYCDLGQSSRKRHHRTSRSLNETNSRNRTVRVMIPH
jgi:hypothetical protein